MGRAFNGTLEYYNRLPAAAQGVVREDVWKLSQMSTGMFVPFTTDSPAIALNWSLAAPPNPLWHMPASGTAGADLFRWQNTPSRQTNTH